MNKLFLALIAAFAVTNVSAETYIAKNVTGQNIYELKVSYRRLSEKILKIFKGFGHSIKDVTIQNIPANAQAHFDIDSSRVRFLTVTVKFAAKTVKYTFETKNIKHTNGNALEIRQDGVYYNNKKLKEESVEVTEVLAAVAVAAQKAVTA